jgi:hypothetical protein
MGRRNRQRERLRAPHCEYSNDAVGTLVLRGALSPGSRRSYAEALGGSPLSREDAWQRATELLFERLAVSWTVAEVDYTRPKELLARYRVASQSERRAVRDLLREHVAEHFPELEAP